MYREFGGKAFGFTESFTTKSKARKRAEKLKRQGKLVRIVPASKHSRDYGGRWDLYSR